MSDETDEDIDRWISDGRVRTVEILNSLENCRDPRVEILALYMAAISVQLKSSRKITSEQADLVRDEFGVDGLAFMAMVHVKEEVREFLLKRALEN